MDKLWTVGLLLMSLVAAAAADRPELVVQTGHTGYVCAVAFSPDGRTIATGSSDHTVILWNAATGVQQRTLVGHTGGVGAVTFGPDGLTLVSGGEAGDLICWDAVSGERRWSLPGQYRCTHSVAFSLDGRTVIAGTFAGVILLDAASGQERRRLGGYDVRCVAVSADGRLIAAGTCGTGGGDVMLWDAASGELKRTLTGHPDIVYSLAFSPDGQSLASGSVGHMLPTGGGDGHVFVWDTATGERRRDLACGDQGPVTGVAYSPDGRTVASIHGWTRVLWDTATGKRRRTLDEGSGAHCVAFAPDGQTLAVGHEGGLTLWDSVSGERRRTWVRATSQVGGVALSPDGRVLAASWGGDLSLWGASSGERLRVLNGSNRACALAFSPDAHTIAAGGEGHVWLWDVASGELRQTLVGQGDLLCIAFSPDGRILAAGSRDRTVTLWDVYTGARLHVLTGHTGDVCGVAFSPDGLTLASGSDDRTLVLWDVVSGTARRTLTGHVQGVRAMAYSPDGRTLASGSWNHELIVWDLAAGDAHRSLAGSTSAIAALAFSPDSQVLASAGGDDTLTVWDARSGERLRTLVGHTGQVSSVAYSPSGRTLASGSADGTVRLWDAPSGRQLAALLSFDLGADYLCTTPDGYYLGSPGAADRIRWRLGNELFPASQFQDRFRRPDLVAAALAAKELPTGTAPMTVADVPPSARFRSPLDGASVAGDTVEVELVAEGEHELANLELFVNGRPSPALALRRATALDLGVQPGAAKYRRSFTVTVPLPPGETQVKLSAIVHDAGRLQSGPAELTLHRRLPAAAGDPGAAGRGTLHLLTVGINQYQKLNPLKYAGADATALAAAFAGQQGRLFEHVRVTTLIDAQATRSAVRGALFELLEAAREDDTVVLFFAGHGVRDARYRYYFATQEADPTDFAGSCLPMESFETVLGKLSAKHVYAFLDTCHAGGVLGEAQAPTEQLAEGLMRKSGVLVFAASTGEELSSENGAWGHGAFTQALLEGLGGAAAADGWVTLGDLKSYVSKRVAALTDGRQHPRVPWSRDVDEAAKLARTR